MIKKQKIFLIDDDNFLLDMYAVKFKASGFEVEIASEGEVALARLKGGYSPDIILLDVVMPKIDGFEFLEFLRKEKLAVGSKIIILSNLGQKDDIEKAKRFNVDDYIIKASFTPSEIVQKVKEIIGQ